jgi:methionyl-tRNA formyltransferase
VPAAAPPRVVFAGTPSFAEQALDAILAAGHRVVGVLTQPDRPAGRGQRLTPSAVKLRAQAAGVPVLQPSTLRDPEAFQALLALRPDVMVVAAYGLILPQAVLDLPRMGCLNIHASLLPRWRGAAPIVRAIQAGDRETGVCIMMMEAGLDTGPVAIRRVTPIGRADTAATLHDRLATLGAEAIVEALRGLAPKFSEVGADIGLRFVPQPETGVTYARKVEKAEARIDWRLDAEALSCHIRAFDPHPGASSALARQPDEAIRLFSPSVVSSAAGGSGGAAAAQPGEVLAIDDDGIRIGAGKGAVVVAQLQRAGGRRLAVADFIRGYRIEPGDLLS